MANPRVQGSSQLAFPDRFPRVRSPLAIKPAVFAAAVWTGLLFASGGALCADNGGDTGSSLLGETSARHHREGVSEKQNQGEAGLRIEVGAPDGEFIVYDATRPPGRPRTAPGYLAYWHDFETEQVYVYGRLMFAWADVGHALLNLDPDLWIDPAPLLEASPILEDGVAEAQIEDEDPTQWHPATDPLVLEIMGIEPPPDMPANPWTAKGKTGAANKEYSCPASKAGIWSYWAQTRCPAACYDGDPCTHDICTRDCTCYYPFNYSCGSGNPCYGSSDPCCGSSDPCCGSSDPCCGSSDRCCGDGGPCCGSPDPCCDSSDPCCGNPDRCCNDDNPCCGSQDPCCNTNDPCCGDPDRCCNSDNPCCGSNDPCCNSNDPCCGDSDRCCNDDNPCCGSQDPCCNTNDPCCGNPNRCCNDDNPCCGSDDPCCNSNDPCCGNPNPCCNPDNPCCGVSADPCCESADPCCNDPDPCCRNDDPCDPECGDPCLCVTCYDGDPCTDDNCSGGVCDFPPKCSISDGACEKECCVDGICYVDQKAQGCLIATLDATGCPGSTVTLHAMICNDGACAATFELEAEKTGGTAGIESVSVPSSIGVPSAPGSAYVDVSVTIAADSDPGTTATIELTATNSSDGTCGPVVTETCSATATVTVIGVDLDFDGLADEDEADPGGFLCLVVEPPLPAVTMQITGAAGGTGWFEVVSGDQLIQMYEDPEGTQPVMHFNQSWPVSAFPITRYVTGVAQSVLPRDVELKLSYVSDSGPCDDVVNLTVGRHKVPLGGEVSYDEGEGCFEVYVPTRWGGRLQVSTTSGVIENLEYPDGTPYQNNMETGEDKHGWYTFTVTGASSYTVSTSFVQEGEAATRPWNFYWWAKKADYIYDAGNGVAETTAVGDDVQVVAPGSPVNPNDDVVRSGPDGALQSTPGGDDQTEVMINLFDTAGSYRPLLKYDARHGTTAREWERANDQGTEDWEGHCLGAAMASILVNQPTPVGGSAYNTDDLEGLWAELGEKQGIYTIPDGVGSIAAGPPTSGSDSTDLKIATVHRMLEEWIKGAQLALQSNLRGGDAEAEPTDVWNHAVYQFSAVYEEAPGDDEKTVKITNALLANDDHTPPTDDTDDRQVEYVYIVQYAPSGLLDESGPSDFVSVAGDAAFALENLVRVTAATWGGENPNITESGVRADDAAN